MRSAEGPNFKLLTQLLFPCLGTVFEYCDTCLFLVYAGTIARDILGHDNPTYLYAIQLCAAFARPVGAYVIGRIGDRRGPEIALRYSAILMAIVSLQLTYLPSYIQIGIWAPILLFVLRSLQMGICGGELNFAALSLARVCGAKHPNLASGIAWASTSCGWLLAEYARYVLGPEDWRGAFGYVGLFGVCVVLMRYTCPEKPAAIPVHHAEHRFGPLIVFLMSASVAGVTYYTQQYLKPDNPVMTYAIALFANILAGLCCDKFSRLYLMCVGLIGTATVCVFGPWWFCPVMLALWKSPTHAIAHEVLRPGRVCSNSALFYTLGTSLAGQGTMFGCTILDAYGPGYALLWPMACIMIMACALLLYRQQQCHV
jgi:MFS family permease